MKYILCDTPRGQYKIPLYPVAEQRTDYYSCEVDGYEKYSDEWYKEYEFSKTWSEVSDWLLNNSNWEDWKDIAEKVNEKVNVTDKDFWTNSGNFDLIEE